jgi:hypothetical protein
MAVSGDTRINDKFEELVGSAPDAMFDCRTYYWRSPIYITQLLEVYVLFLLFLPHPSLVHTII